MNEAVNLSAIPHRPPFLFVDHVVDISRDRIVTSTLANPDADFFRGHYPDDPVMPGVLICECCFQAGALLIAHRNTSADTSNGIPVLTRITNARFKRIVRPGQTLHVEVTLDDELDGAYFMTGRVTVDGKAVVRVAFAVTRTDRKQGATWDS